MTSRFASFSLLASLLIGAAACGMASDDGVYRYPEAAGSGGKGVGDGGSDDQPTSGGAGTSNSGGTDGGGGDTTVNPAAGAAGTGGTGFGAGGGAAGSSTPGGGAGAGASQNDALCPEDSNTNQQLDCDDTGQICVCPGGAGTCDLVCDYRQPIFEGSSCRSLLLAGRPHGVQPVCAPQAATGPTLSFVFMPTKDGWARFTAAPLVGDVILTATTGECGEATLGGVESVCRNQLGPLGTETVRLQVKEGQPVTLLVTGATGADDKAEFSLDLRMEVPDCGNGQVEGGEVCDDGGKGDFCSKTCDEFVGCKDATALADATDDGAPTPVAVEALGEGMSTAQSSCGTVGSQVRRVIYALRAANTGRLEAQVAASAGRDLTLSVRSSCEAGQELGCSDHQGASVGNAPLPLPERLSLASVKGETYYLMVEGYGADEGGYQLSARTLPVACGDGVRAPSVEQCDPVVDALCEPTCTRSITAGPDATAPVKLDASQGWTSSARVFPAGDVDEYVVKSEQPMRVSVLGAPGSSDCADLRLDSQLTVLNAQGQVVAFNDDVAPGGTTSGYCSEVTLPAGDYRVRVRSSEASAPAQVFSYRVVASVVPAP